MTLVNDRLRWMTAKQTAEYLQVSLPTLNRIAKSIPIPCSKPAGPKGARRFFRSHVDAALRSRIENNPAA